jgi:hypothetical protein
VYGQGYVALSRVRSLAGLKVLGMHPNALQVDPKVVNRDKQFRAESDQAEDTFVAMPADELTLLHTQFVTSCGGKLPEAGTVSKSGKRAVKERVAKLSTYDETRSRWVSGQSLKQIAKEREVGLGTIVEHIEKMVEQKILTSDDLVRAIDELDETGAARRDIGQAMTELGDEKLKPLYEATGEQYGYELIRLVRALARLS